MTLFSKWGKSIDFKNPLPEYPRMQMQRDSFYNLNGIWEYQIVSEDAMPDPDDWKKIVVPFALGTALSGTEEVLKPKQALWYRRQFAYKPSVLETWLNFEAVDTMCIVYLNGVQVGSHAGGYTPFSINVSSQIKYQNALMVCCKDASNYGKYAWGKQKIEHGGMWYKPTAGIWGTVWLENTSVHAVQDLKITPDYDGHSVHVDLAGDFDQALITVSVKGHVIHSGVTNNKHYDAPVEDMHPWSPDDPFLYDLYVQTEDDVVRSYFGMRKFSAGRDARGIMRFELNDRPLFLSGLLDQGYSVDGSYTYVDDEAIVYELTKIKEMGFNCLRKHAKIDSRRWYYHCDRLGILVMQDMPSGGMPSYDFLTTALLPNMGFRHMKDTKPNRFTRPYAEKKYYYDELEEMLSELYNSTCIFAWVPFNEGWGQFESGKVTDKIRNYDQTRLIDSASGWHDQGCGDFDSYHSYFMPFHAHKDKKDRIVILSECGGYSYVENGHSAPEKEYGYKKFKSKLEYNDAFFDLYEKQILPEIRNGLSGCIYTQVSDVEDECNGIFSADREVIKIDERRMRRVNERCMRRLLK